MEHFDYSEVNEEAWPLIDAFGAISYVAIPGEYNEDTMEVGPETFHPISTVANDTTMLIGSTGPGVEKTSITEIMIRGDVKIPANARVNVGGVLNPAGTKIKGGVFYAFKDIQEIKPGPTRVMWIIRAVN